MAILTGLPWWGWEDANLDTWFLGLRQQVLSVFSGADGIWNQNNLEVIDEKEDLKNCSDFSYSFDL